jgi:Domain of unknown function (DUF5103)
MRFLRHSLGFCCCIALAWMFVGCAAMKAAASYITQKPIVRGLRVFGGANETTPPFIYHKTDNSPNTSNGETLGASFVTVELDVQTQGFPAFAVTFVHCDMLWREDVNNIIINNPMLRTTQVDVRQASAFSKYFTHRARFIAPNNEVKLNFTGNWKAKIFDMNDLNTPLAEARFFIVEQVGESSLVLLSDTYRPKIGGTSPSAYVVDASIKAPSEYIDDNFQSVVLYRNQRWNEPRIITQDPSLGRTEALYNNAATTTVTGFSAAQKRFRIMGIPAENEYRILDISNPAFAPASGNAAIRFGLADMRRNGGTIMVRADDGVLTTRTVSSSHDEYVLTEFVLDPENVPSSQDLFVVGSFNGWQADLAWKLEYIPQERLYKLRQWIRRGRHNYLYASGRINTRSGMVDNISFEECEGNTFSANQTFYALFYYRNPMNGGYDALYGVAGENAMRRSR